MNENLGEKLLVQKMLLSNEFMIYNLQVKFKHCISCIKRLRTVLLNTLCWLVTKITAKCRHKESKHTHVFQTCFLLSFSRRAWSLLPDVWLLFKVVFKHIYICIYMHVYIYIYIYIIYIYIYIYNICIKNSIKKKQQNNCARMIKIDKIEYNLSKILSVRVWRLKTQIL